MLTTKSLQLAILAGMILPAAAHAQFNISTYDTGAFQITNLETADRLISGFRRTFQQTATYTTSNTQDDGNGAGPFGLGAQIVGLPPGDNEDFAFQAVSSFNVTATGSYTFFNDTDDGSRLRLSINGGPFNTIILDDVLSGPHTVNSSPVPLSAGDAIQLQWTWFERGGGAEGETFYSNDGGTSRALWETPSLGLTLVGGSYNGTVHKAQGPRSGVNPNGPNNLAEADAYVTSGVRAGTSQANTLNFGGGGRAPGENPFPTGTPGDHFVLVADGIIRVAPDQTGEWTFFTNSDDGARLRINGVDVVVDDFLQGPTDSAYGVFNFSAPGDYSVSFLGFENGGGESFEAFTRRGNFAAAKGQGDPTGFVVLGDPAGLTVVPEPATAGLAALGLLALASRRRRSA